MLYIFFMHALFLLACIFLFLKAKRPLKIWFCLHNNSTVIAINKIVQINHIDVFEEK